MIVVDASVLTAVLVDADTPETGHALRVLHNDPHWVVPEHAMIETISAIRGLALGGAIPRADVPGIVQELLALTLDVWPTAPLAGRVIELMDKVTAYDAAYLALAEELSTTLVTLDRRLGAVPGIRCIVRVL
jgi:predicted nucleic acid-binding protein